MPAGEHLAARQLVAGPVLRGQGPGDRPGRLPHGVHRGHRKAHKRAEDKLAEFRTQVNNQRSTPFSVKLGYAIDEWMRTSEHENSTREGYRGYIARTIDPRSATCR